MSRALAKLPALPTLTRVLWLRALAGPGVRVLDLKPGAIHERVPVFLGSADDVAEAEAALAADAGHLQVRA